MSTSQDPSSAYLPEATPKAEFIEDVGKYLENQKAEDAIQALNENYRRLKMVESRLLQRRAYNLGKLPELKKTLGLVEMLATKVEEDQKVSTCMHVGAIDAMIRGWGCQ